VDDLDTALVEDSEDLTHAEVDRSIITCGVDELIAHVKAWKCERCGQPTEGAPSNHALRRRAPHLYARMRVVCANPEQHESTLVFRVDWLQSESTFPNP
jgi:hypothetical protein